MTNTTAENQFYFTPRNPFWQMNREQVLLLGGGRVLLMQIAHPMVAEAVYNHSYVFKKPLLRLHRTLSLTFAIVYATKPEADVAIAEIERAHRPAVGRLADAVGKHAAGASYNARNPRQGLWVWATLVEGAMSTYERLVAPVDLTVKEAFYADSTTLQN
ncbi:MAG: oxygenase MpaB family protein [Anaerolineae bacterium]|nr:oxygenase MpaB family protein [Anaerolineae bacterium]